MQQQISLYNWELIKFSANTELSCELIANTARDVRSVSRTKWALR